MAKARKKKATEAITPEQALQFLADIRLLGLEKDEPTVLISLRVPQNMIRALKLRAKSEGRRYQTLMIQLLRRALRDPR